MSPNTGAVAPITVSRARSWNTEPLSQHAGAWLAAAQKIENERIIVVSDAVQSDAYWQRESGDAMRTRARGFSTETAKLVNALNTAATAAATAAQDISAHRFVVVKYADDATANKFDVADDGTVTASKALYTTLVARVGAALANKHWEKLVTAAADRTTTLKQALADLLAADLRGE
ncbi:hypothetical protein [Nocardia sp. NPDC058705]|uniref:hypothetical protein n=1 Tax=Nocardia sp. NPDC058705 TaxID=3346609 RepID=UPI0036954DD8